MNVEARTGFDFSRVDLTDVSKHFGRRRAVSHITLSVQCGEILGLLGPNGAGKSTLMGMMATLVTPTAGTIVYGGPRAHDGRAPLRRRIGVLAHELHLYPELSARQNLMFFADLYELNASAVVPKALERAALTERADDDVSTFSRGMRQRLALERALLHEPRLALLDEPFTGLDDHAIGVVAARLRQLASTGAIVVLATHDLDVAEGLITRAAVIRDGRLVTDEPAGQRLRERYRAHLNAVSGSGEVPVPTPEAESLRSSPKDDDARPGSAGEAVPTPEAESLRSRPKDNDAQQGSGGGAPRR